ncbi:RutC family protein [bioreactor metagenome]|uniref:RutC family protein n=1 Tax=bioreactor metagenome TaxID=1076179 RepID=A0A645ERS2_9ZZZZ
MNKETVFSQKAPDAIGPYSQAIKCGKLLFVSGQLPVDKETGLMPFDIKQQTTQSLENIKHIIAAAGYSMQDIVKTTVFVKDLGQFQAINDVYSTYFPNNPPARACIEVAGLPKGAGVEIEVIACTD